MRRMSVATRYSAIRLICLRQCTWPETSIRRMPRFSWTWSPSRIPTLSPRNGGRSGLPRSRPLWSSVGAWSPMRLLSICSKKPWGRSVTGIPASRLCNAFKRAGGLLGRLPRRRTFLALSTWTPSCVGTLPTTITASFRTRASAICSSTSAWMFRTLPSRPSWMTCSPGWKRAGSRLWWSMPNTTAAAAAGFAGSFSFICAPGTRCRISRPTSAFPT